MVGQSRDILEVLHKENPKEKRHMSVIRSKQADKSQKRLYSEL